MALGPEISALMAEFAKSDGKPLHEMGVEEARELSRALTSLGMDPVAVGSVEDVDLAVPGGSILLRVLTPVSVPRGVIMFAHGGGWVIGSAEEWTSIASHLAAATQCIVILPDYRLAPEYRFPVPVDDCWAALVWASETYNLPLIVGAIPPGETSPPCSPVAPEIWAVHCWRGKFWSIR